MVWQFSYKGVLTSLFQHFQALSNFQATSSIFWILQIIGINKHQILSLQYKSFILEEISLFFTLLQSVSPFSLCIQLPFTDDNTWKYCNYLYIVHIKQTKLNSPLTHITFSKQQKILLQNQCIFFPLVKWSCVFLLS